MAKSENVRNRVLIEEYFKKGDRLSRRKFEQLLLNEDGKVLEKTLLAFLYDEVENIVYISDINYLFKAFLYLEVLVEKYPELNKNRIERKLCKILEKLDRIEEEKQDDFYDKKKVIEKIKKFRDLIYDLEDKIELKKDNYYELIRYFIFEIKNIGYIEKILQTFNHAIRAKDMNGKTIFSNVVDKYIEVINSDIEERQEEILYYKNIISLMKTTKGFSISDVEKHYLLQNIYHNINFLNQNDDKYLEKRDSLNELKELLKNENDKTTIKKIASYYNIEMDFEKTLLDELDVYRSNYQNYPDRKVINDYMITIDGKDAQEIDDGLTAKVLKNGNYLLGVHIASVLGYLPFESNLVQTAISRGSSIYLAKNGIYCRNEEDKVIPIFPYSFSAGDASLIEGESRLANSYFFEIDKEGNIVNEKFEKTIVKNRRRCTYTEANNVIDYGSKKESELETTLHLLYEISNVLDSKFHPSEIYQALKSQSNNPAKVILGNSVAEHIVSQCMTLTGSEVGGWFKDSKRDYPCLLRVHEIGDECIQELQEAIDNFTISADKEKFERLFESLAGIYPKAYYDLNGKHDGMNLEHYCHITSPLRRSADILQEYALDKCYFTNPSDKELYELEKILIDNKNKINAQNNAIDYFMDDCRFQKRLLRKAK